MNIIKIMNKIKKNPRYGEVGMVLYHNGIVRNTSRNGLKVKGLKISADWDLLSKIIDEKKNDIGIIDIAVEINTDKFLVVGDDVMYIAVAGNIRENVISTFTNVLNIVKGKVTKKVEFFV